MYSTFIIYCVFPSDTRHLFLLFPFLYLLSSIYILFSSFLFSFLKIIKLNEYGSWQEPVMVIVQTAMDRRIPQNAVYSDTSANEDNSFRDHIR